MTRKLLIAATAVQATTLIRPALGAVMYLRSRDRLDGQRQSVLDAIRESA